MINQSGKQLSKTVKRFLEIVQPLPVKYGYSRGIRTEPALVTYYLASTQYRETLGQGIASERATYVVTVQTASAESNIYYTQLIKRGTTGTGIVFVSDSVRKDTTVKNGWISTIMLYVYTALDIQDDVFELSQVQDITSQVVDNYATVMEQYDQSLAQQIRGAVQTPTENRTYTFEEMSSFIQSLRNLVCSLNLDGITMANTLKHFLELVQPLPVKYAYSKELRSDTNHVEYFVQSTQYRTGISNELIAEKQTSVIYVRTKTAEENMLYSELIKRATSRTGIRIISSSMSNVPASKAAWLTTIVVAMSTDLDLVQKAYSPEEVRNVLQEIARFYIFVTSIYDRTLDESFIDKLVVPPLDKSIYSIEEFIEIKRQYLDKVVYTDTQF